MTEATARAWLVDVLGVSRETLDRLALFAAAVISENDRQNLVSAATIPTIWDRHILDSAQLVPMLGDVQLTHPWLDLGTGAGFPGIVIAILLDHPVILVESRRKRFEFLSAQCTALGLSHVRIHGGALEALETHATSVISARAFAPLGKLITLAHRFAHEKTLWLLPKGRSAREELESVQSSWQGVFHVEPSLTDPEAAIIVASGVSPRKSKR
jgi:16S rRNA (guanine527-N7)-methyltransferase